MSSEYINNKFIEENGINWIFDFLNQNNSSFIFKQIDPELVEISLVHKTSPIWTSGSQLSSIYTQSFNSEYSKNYSLDVYSAVSCTNVSKEFTIEYGNNNGNGIEFDYPTNKTDTRAVYTKYKKITEDIEPEIYDNFVAIQFNKIKNQNRIYSDVFSITLTNPHTSSIYSTLITLTDTEYFTTQSNVYDLISGSLESGGYLESGSYVYYGKVYPQHSLILFNTETLNYNLGFNIQNELEDVNQKIPEKVYNSISSSIFNVNQKNINYWSFVNVETEHQIMTFPIRMERGEYNYSTNPTYYYSDGKLKYNQYVDNPISYFTSIGLYNDKYELLAIAKLSRPIFKDFTEKYTFQVSIEIL